MSLAFENSAPEINDSDTDEEMDNVENQSASDPKEVDDSNDLEIFVHEIKQEYEFIDVADL